MGRIKELSLENFSSKDISHADPLLHFLSANYLSPIVIGIGYSLFFRSLLVLSTWLHGHLQSSGQITGMLEDPSLYTNIISGAVVFGYYTWLPRGISAVIKNLFKSGVVGSPKDKTSMSSSIFLQNMATSFNKWYWPAISLSITIIAYSALILPRYLSLSESAAWAADPFSLAIASFWIFVGIYCILTIALFSIMSITWLKKLFSEFSITILPLHPDGSGGLSPLGNYALKLSYLIVLVGLILVITPITRNFVINGTFEFFWTSELIVALGAYLIAAPVIFFLPLSVAHRVMQEAKNHLLIKIANRFSEEYSLIQKALSQKDIDIKQNLEIMEQLQDLHRTIDSFPVWPFDSANLIRFATSYITPLLTAILATIIDIVIKK